MRDRGYRIHLAEPRRGPRRKEPFKGSTWAMPILTGEPTERGWLMPWKKLAAVTVGLLLVVAGLGVAAAAGLRQSTARPASAEVTTTALDPVDPSAEDPEVEVEEETEDLEDEA